MLDKQRLSIKPGFLASFLLLTSVPAQVPVAELDALSPPGGQAGQSVTVQPQGSNLDELAGVIVSDPEIQAEIENGQLRLTIPQDLTPRIVDLAVHGRFGISNPRAFTIGTFPELTESGDHNQQEKAQEIPLGHTVNGTADAAALDWYTVTPAGTKPIVIEVLAERIDSRMDPTLVILDAQGRELARHHDIRGRDVTATFTPPVADQPLFIGVHDFLYEGGGNHFYRLTLAHDLPATHFPKRAPADLPAAQLSQDVTAYDPDKTIESLPASIRGTCPQGMRHHIDLLLEESGPVVVEIFSERLDDSSDFRLWVDRVQEVAELKKVGENDDIDDPVKNARFRLGSRDPLVTFPAEAKTPYRVTFFNQFQTGGAYRMEIRRPQPDIHLIAAAEKPHELNNQHSRWVPVLRREGTIHWEILALRRDGFNGPVTVRVDNLPPGISAPDLVIAAGQHSGTLTLTASAEAPAFAGPISIIGAFENNDQARQRPAVGASLLWSIGDANRERWESRLTHTPLLAVLEQETAPITLKPAETTFETCLADKLEIPFTIKRLLGQAGNFKVSLYGLPGLNKSPEATFDPNAEEVKLTLDLANKDNNKFTPGKYVVHARAWEGKVKHRANPEAAERAEAEHASKEEMVSQLTAEVGALRQNEAPDSEIAEVEKRLEAAKQAKDAAAKRAEEAKKNAEPRELDHVFLSQPIVLHIEDGPLRFTPPASMEFAPGEAGDFPVKFERRHGFTGPVDLTLSPPEDQKIFEPASVTVAKDAGEATLAVQVAAEAKPGSYEATLEAKLEFNGQELKISEPISLILISPPTNPS